MKLRYKILQCSMVWIILAGFLAAAKPSTLPAVLFIVPFMLLLSGLYSTWQVLGLAYTKLTYGSDAYVPHPRLAMILCACFVASLALQSLGQLTLRDIVTVCAILALGYVYATRTILAGDQRS